MGLEQMKTQFLNDGPTSFSLADLLLGLGNETPATFINDERVVFRNDEAEQYAEHLKQDVHQLILDQRMFKGGDDDDSPGACCWPVDLNVPRGTPNEGWALIVRTQEGKYFQVPFKIGSDGEPALAGEPVEVEMETTFEPVGGDGDEKIEPSAEQMELGKDAARQKAELGQNPPNWAVDEPKWEKAKGAADKSYDEDDDAYWPSVVTIYENMGGTIKGKKAK